MHGLTLGFAILSIGVQDQNLFAEDWSARDFVLENLSQDWEAFRRNAFLKMIQRAGVGWHWFSSIRAGFRITGWLRDSLLFSSPLETASILGGCPDAPLQRH